MTTPLAPADSPPAPHRLRLRLYVAGQSAHSRLAVTRLHALLAEYPYCSADTEIFDVLEDPHRAFEAGVFLTPMLVRLEPLPECSLFGNLSDRDALVRMLLLGPPPP